MKFMCFYKRKYMYAQNEIEFITQRQMTHMYYNQIIL